MKRSNPITSIVLALVLLAVSASTQARDNHVHMRYVQTQLSTQVDSNGDEVVAYQLITKYRGSPGRAQSMGISEVGEFIFGPGPGCPEGLLQAHLPILVYEDTLVFNNLATLSVSADPEGQSVLCVGFTETGGFDTATRVDLIVTNGTGRFAGASGRLRSENQQLTNPVFEYVAVEGTLRGQLHYDNEE